MTPIPKLLQNKQFGPTILLMSVRSDQARLRIREEMERQRLSQRELVQLLGDGWTQSGIQKILVGRVQLTVDDLESICFALGIHLTEVVRDHGLEFCAEMTPTEMRMLERLRQMPTEERDLYLRLMEVKAHTRAEPRGATQKRPIIPRGRTR